MTNEKRSMTMVSTMMGKTTPAKKSRVPKPSPASASPTTQMMVTQSRNEIRGTTRSRNPSRKRRVITPKVSTMPSMPIPMTRLVSRRASPIKMGMNVPKVRTPMKFRKTETTRAPSGSKSNKRSAFWVRRGSL